MILAGDVGGTKVRLALFADDLFAPDNASLSTTCDSALVLERFESKSADSLEAIVGDFLARHGAQGKITSFCIGAPGPVINAVIKTTNLPWEIRRDNLVALINTKRGSLVNDLVATIASVPALGEKDCRVVFSGKPEREKRVFAVVAPGTGLGQAFMVIDDHGRAWPFPSEGGHVEFAPKSELEIEFLYYLREKKAKRISAERLLCGPGLANIYSFLRDTGKEEEPSALRDEIGSKDPAPVVSKHAIAGTYPICVRALEMFVQTLGSFCGDVVLALISTGGMYLGGGIPPKILAKLQTNLFVDAYLDKGRLSPIVAATPVSVIVDDRAALLGAATIASRIE